MGVTQSGVILTLVKDSMDYYTIPHHRLIKRITRTGMSSVYLAEALENHQQVIIKLLDFDPEDENRTVITKRFLQEFDLLKNLHHRNIVNIHERYSTNDYSCLIMEYLSGGDLSIKIANNEVGTFEAIEYLTQITSALDAVHKLNIIHRDLKPRNILFRADNTLAISDFGIAIQSDKSFGLTHQGIILGTPYYMSPEQIDNSYIDQRSDLYSLGVIFYEMLTGEKPFRGNSLMKIFYSHINDPVPYLPERQAKYQPLINCLLAKRPQDRFENVAALRQAINEIGGEIAPEVERLPA